MRESNPPLQLEGLTSWADGRTDLDRELQWVVKELNLPPSASQLDGNGFTGRREEHHPVIPPRVARVGVEPTGPPGLSRVALPVCVPCRPSHFSAPGGIRTRDLLADNEASTPGCSAGAIAQDSGPGGSRTLRHLLLRQAALPVCLPGRGVSRGGSRGTRTHKRDSPPPVFKTGSGSGRLASVVR